MNWIAIAKAFSGPLGNLVNYGIGAASAATITWAVSKGLDKASATNIVAGVVGLAGAIINAATGTQTVQIQNIRENQSNGVTVVPARDAERAGLRRVDGPEPTSGN